MCRAFVPCAGLGFNHITRLMSRRVENYILQEKDFNVNVGVEELLYIVVALIILA